MFGLFVAKYKPNVRFKENKMNKKFILLLLFLAGIFNILRAQDSLKYLSLRECLKIGFKSSQSIINASLEKEKRIAQKGEAVSKLLPHLEGFGTYDNYVKLPVTMIPGEIFGMPGTTIPVSLAMKHNVSGGLKATQLLYNQTVITALSLSEKMKEISNLSFDKALEDFIYETTRLYFLIKVTDAQKSILEENLFRMDRLLKISGSQFDAGFIRSIDYDRIKISRENMATEMINLNVLFAQQLDMLRYVMGIKDKTGIILTDSLQFNLYDKKISDTNSMHTDLVLWEKQKELALINKKMVSSGYYPTLTLYGQYFYQGQREKFDFLQSGENKWFKVGIVGLSFSLPIFDGLEKHAQSEQAECDYLQASNNYEFTQRFLLMEYNNAFKRYNYNREVEQRQKENIELAERVYEKMYLQYKQGTAPLTDLLSAESSLSESRLSALNTTLNLRLAELDLIKASGNLKSIINK
jgi:outer membrane protein